MKQEGFEAGVTVGKPVYGGGFVLEDGAVLPFVLPGEEVRASDGIVTVNSRSRQRREPGCVHFGVCGGCHYQHGVYEAQVGWKRAILAGLLGGLALPEIEVVSGAEWGYRNRARLRLKTVDGAVRVGYSRRGTNEFLPVVMCPISAGAVWRTAEALVRAGAEDAAVRRVLEKAAEVEVFAAGDESRVQMLFAMGEPCAEREFEALCERVQAELPELAGAGALMEAEAGRRARRAWAGVGWGAAGLPYEVAGRSYFVGRGAFFQVNRFLLGELVELVCAGESGGLAWDLFAGVGLFSRVLAESFGRVVAVEGAETAAADLAVAAKGGKGRVSFEAVRAPAVEFLRGQVLQRERPELVVLDPPRAGLGVEGAELLGRVGPARVVYVSCDPVTLARDLRVLCGAGYGVERVTLVDLFPQTFHLETVVRLRRQ